MTKLVIPLLLSISSPAAQISQASSNKHLVWGISKTLSQYLNWSLQWQPHKLDGKCGYCPRHGETRADGPNSWFVSISPGICGGHLSRDSFQLMSEHVESGEVLGMMEIPPQFKLHFGMFLMCSEMVLNMDFPPYLLVNIGLQGSLASSLISLISRTDTNCGCSYIEKTNKNTPE